MAARIARYGFVVVDTEIRQTVTSKTRRNVGISWRMDETYIKVKDAWAYLYRPVDKQSKTVDFLLTAHRDIAAARQFFKNQ